MKVIFQNVLGVLTSIGNFIKKLLLIIANWLFTIPNTPDKSSLITIINIVRFSQCIIIRGGNNEL